MNTSRLGIDIDQWGTGESLKMSQVTAVSWVVSGINLVYNLWNMGLVHKKYKLQVAWFRLLGPTASTASPELTRSVSDLFQTAKSFTTTAGCPCIQWASGIRRNSFISWTNSLAASTCPALEHASSTSNSAIDIPHSKNLIFQGLICCFSGYVEFPSCNTIPNQRMTTQMALTTQHWRHGFNDPLPTSGWVEADSWRLNMAVKHVLTQRCQGHFFHNCDC